VRTEDSIARTAEASFMVLAAGTAAPQMLALAQRLQRELTEAKITYRGTQLKIGSRFGVASLGVDAVDTVEELFRLAAQRLQSAPTAPAALPAAPSIAGKLPHEIEHALAVLEKADPGRLGAAAKEVLHRLHAIAKLLQSKS